MIDVRCLCLGVLSLGEATGYEIRKRLKAYFGPYQGVSYGALYPALAKLLASGEVVSSEAAAASTLEKRSYKITEKGRESLHSSLDTARGQEQVRSEFMAAMFFADQLKKDTLDRLIDERLAELRGDMAQFQGFRGSPGTEGQRFVSRYGQVLCRAAIDFLQGEGRAIASAIERDRQG
ncbi:MAG: PadR family transcriptional regulator [Alphaproteobacteria bacterium]|nr:PadR family transcriptional regulator [Alphaproteobacteria bacterium]MBU0796588.1 PadR family transcriptional regulator [Alphaproteobacteria bacterium]MBU0886343.1 PadR family transcriptional regulator [Alphaproteobacteria bacterium]MBU1813461.1 PadR family transcriptional regulator [Alphaproteobacteria bacterium]MBU2089770.1 PadR family transcriptional regulator [Alphaproteobacteria bacterium]